MHRKGVKPEAVARGVRTPLYNQIFLILRNRILTGEAPNGSFLPSEFDIAASFHVSRITAKRALNELAEAGLAVRQRGRGTRVRYRGGGTIVTGSVQSLVDSLRANARNETSEVLDFDYVPASAEVAGVLKLPEGEIVQRATRSCSEGDVPYSLLTTFVPATIGKAWTASDLAQDGLLSLLERAGINIGFAEQRMNATLADARTAAALRVAVGSPLMQAHRVAYDERDVPVEYLIALYPPERYQFIVTLTNERDGAG